MWNSQVADVCLTLNTRQQTQTYGWQCGETSHNPLASDICLYWLYSRVTWQPGRSKESSKCEIYLQAICSCPQHRNVRVLTSQQEEREQELDAPPAGERAPAEELHPLLALLTGAEQEEGRLCRVSAEEGADWEAGEGERPADTRAEAAAGEERLAGEEVEGGDTAGQVTSRWQHLSHSKVTQGRRQNRKNRGFSTCPYLITPPFFFQIIFHYKAFSSNQQNIGNMMKRKMTETTKETETLLLQEQRKHHQLTLQLQRLTVRIYFVEYLTKTHIKSPGPLF